MSLLIDGRRYSRFHFVGVLGSGMSALAQYLLYSGCSVSGSDRLLGCDEVRALEHKLAELGCRLYYQDGSGVEDGIEAVVVSTAIEDSNPDIIRAKHYGISLFHRSDILASIVNNCRSIAVAGTSGKSTVTAMIFEFLTHCKRSPSVICGAPLISLEGLGMIGNTFYGSSPILVFEADESDGTCTKYKPAVSVLLNISKDHKSVEETTEILGLLASHSEFVIINADDQRLATFRCNMNYGLLKQADFGFEKIEYKPLSTIGYRNGIAYELKLPGEHNAYNLCAALCVCNLFGCQETLLAEAVKQYQGVKRRFSTVLTEGGIYVVDDYAHNPEKIAAALKTARRLSKRIIAIFQPHGFGPLRFFATELVNCLSELLNPNDILILLPVYYAGGTVQKDCDSVSIANRLLLSGFDVFTPSNREQALDIIKNKAQPGDCVISMGARDPSLETFAKTIVHILN